MTLCVRVRRYFCDEPSCERAIFCERLSDVAARTLEDAEEQEKLLDAFEAKIESDPRGVLAADVAIAREMLKLQRRAIERYGEGVEPGFG